MYIPGKIQTPQGVGKYIGFDGNTGKVTVEIDGMYLVEYDGDECYVKLENRAITLGRQLIKELQSQGMNIQNGNGTMLVNIWGFPEIGGELIVETWASHKSHIKGKLDA